MPTEASTQEVEEVEVKLVAEVVAMVSSNGGEGPPQHRRSKQRSNWRTQRGFLGLLLFFNCGPCTPERTLPADSSSLVIGS